MFLFYRRICVLPYKVRLRTQITTIFAQKSTALYTPESTKYFRGFGFLWGTLNKQSTLFYRGVRSCYSASRTGHAQAKRLSRGFRHIKKQTNRIFKFPLVCSFYILLECIRGIIPCFLLMCSHF